MTRRWAETNDAQRLVAGGHVANLAKYLAARITDVLERNSSKVDAPGVAMFFSQSVADMVVDPCGKHVRVLQARSVDLEAPRSH